MTTMKEILFRKHQSTKKRMRITSISERSEDKGNLTHTQKAFIYMIEPQKMMRNTIAAPEYFVTKYYHTKEKKEVVHFKIKGVFYVRQKTQFYKINYCHSLKIEVVEKENKDTEESVAQKESTE